MKKNHVLLLTLWLFLIFTGCINTQKKTGSAKPIKAVTETKKTTDKKTPPTQAPKAKSLIVENVAVTAKTVDVSKGEKVGITYKLTLPAEEVAVTFYNAVNQIIKEFSLKDVNEGKNTIEWDGKKDDGSLCETDSYVFVIKAKKGERQFTYNPAVNTGNMKLDIEKASIDKEKMEIEYVLPKAARVRIRLGIEESALLLTIQEWMIEEAGRHILSWNGWDKDRLIQFAKDPRIAVAIEAYSLPSNSVIIKSDREPDYLARVRWLASGKALTYPLPVLSKAHIREPKFTLSLAEEYPVNENKVPVVSGKVPVTIKISPEDREILINSRYELMYYVDTVFLYEEEQAYDPFTYILNTEGMKEGEHIFTVNLLGYNMSVGINSIKVFVKSQEPGK